ncbi:hypothetical protein BGZ65_012769, partial [Modicella reniformis]
DIFRVSMQSSAGIANNLVPRLDHFLTNFRRELQYQHNRHERLHYSQIQPPKNFHGERISIHRGLYKGVSFALVFQVPALALFLSTYDATKHTIAQLAHSANLNAFNLYDVETHLVSGMIAKATGTVVWAPMNRLQGLATHPVTGQAPLTLKEAYRLTQHICRSEGISGLWSGYTKSCSTLLPYTMIYFATYEQFKLLAGWIVSSKANRKTFDRGGDSDKWNSWAALREYYSVWGQRSHPATSTALTLDMYMMCVASSVVISSAVCQTASAVRAVVWDQHRHLSSKAGSASPLSKFVNPLQRQPLSISPFSAPKHLPSALSVAAPKGIHSFKTLLSSSSNITTQAMTGLPWQQSQHATLTTTSLLPIHNTTFKQLSKPSTAGRVHLGSFFSSQSLNLPGSTVTSWQQPVGQLYKPGYLMSTILSPVTSTLSSDNERSKNIMNNINAKSNRAPSLFRTIARSLGPRIMWTVPGVTLTTAGFEVLRSMALGC